MSCITIMIKTQIVRGIPPIQNVIGRCIDRRFERLTTMITRARPILYHVLTFRRYHLNTSFKRTIFFAAATSMMTASLGMTAPVNVILIHGL